MEVLVVPLLKNRLRDPSDSNNYRPIAIATATSKVFERLILGWLSDYIQTSDNQFGFKAGHSTDMCTAALKEVIHYYRNLGTPCYVCFIDIKSAFDRVSYWKLFCKLLQRGTPICIILLLEYWYTKQEMLAGWGNARSDAFTMSNGIRQGSVLSPHLFNLYVDDLSHLLDSTGVECDIGGLPANNFYYADDLALLCPSAGP